MTQDELKKNMEGRYISQICVGSNDIERTMNAWIDIMGVGPWLVLTAVPSTIANAIVGNKPRPDDCDFKNYCGLAQLGNLQLEIVQPVYGDDGWINFLKEHGESWNHFKEHIPGNQVLTKGYEFLEKKGMTIVSYGEIDEDRFLNLATYEKVGMNYEIGNTGRINFPDELCRTYPENDTKELEQTSKSRFIGDISFIAQDMGKALKGWTEVLEAGPWKVVTVTQADLKNVIVEDKPFDGEIKYIRAIMQWGDKSVEIIQPIKGVPTFDEYTQKSVNGMHHVTERVDDADLEKRLKEFASKGIGICFAAQLGEERFYYMDTVKKLGCQIVLSNFADPNIGKETVFPNK
jgi:hypothetical protein